jgi:hypothetical protein
MPQEISPKCKVPAGQDLDPQPLIYKSIEYICIPDREEVIIATGSPGNGYKLKLEAVKAKAIGLYYRNLTSRPTTTTLNEVIDTFILK